MAEPLPDKDLGPEPDLADVSSNGASSNGTGPSAEKDTMRLGGMALRNGLLIHGPTSWSVAARNGSGGIDVTAGPKPNFGGNRFAKVPIVRGPLRMAEAFAVIPIARRKLPSSRLPFEDVRVIAAAAATTVISAMVRGNAETTNPAREAAAGALGLAPALVALSGSELAAYHAVEHKAIGGYEQHKDPEEMPKEHQRCGSNMIVPMIFFSTIGQLAVDAFVENPGRVARGISGIAGLSLSVEVFVHADKHPGSPIGRAIHWAGDAIQRLFATREPTPQQMEVGVAALAAVLEAEQG